MYFITYEGFLLRIYTYINLNVIVFLLNKLRLSNLKENREEKHHEKSWLSQLHILFLIRQITITRSTLFTSIEYLNE